jgi:hypothetical protein
VINELIGMVDMADVIRVPLHYTVKVSDSLIVQGTIGSCGDKHMG